MIKVVLFSDGRPRTHLISEETTVADFLAEHCEDSGKSRVLLNGVEALDTDVIKEGQDHRLSVFASEVKGA